MINKPRRAEAIKGAEWVKDVRQRFLKDAMERMEAEKVREARVIFGSGNSPDSLFCSYSY